MIDLAIIGAGPYGLSIAAYLRAEGIKLRIFGKPMISWEKSMPPGMMLKSHPWASCLYDPKSEYTLEKYCAEQKIPYHDSLMHLPVETFVAYGKAFKDRFAPDVEEKLLVRLEESGGGFRCTFDDGDVVVARKVIMAIGIHSFKHVPDELKGLPAGTLSHSGDHGPLDQFKGREVAVIGSGSSATDLAGLLREKGASVSLIARANELKFSEAHRTQRSFFKRMLYPLKPLIRPGTGIGGGWDLKIYCDFPWLFHMMPESWRIRTVRTTLGPLGHSTMKDRVIGKVPLFLGRFLKSAEMVGGKVALHLTTRDGARETVKADHVIAATGYQIDLAQPGFFSANMLARIKTAGGGPVLSLNYESTIPGLFFAGAATAPAFGPVNRFVFGANHPSAAITRYLVETRSSQPAPAPERPRPSVAGAG